MSILREKESRVGDHLSHCLMMRDQNQPCVLALEKRLVENGKNCEKFYEKDRYSEISEKPEMKTRICREENFCVGGIICLLVYIPIPH